MAFLVYFFVLLVSAASVLFGLDLMSSPLPKTPNVPIGRSVQVTAQVASPVPVQEPHKKAADEQALTPVYPTTRGAAKVPAETSGAAPQQDAKLTPPPAEQTAPTVTSPAPTATPPSPAATVAQNPASVPAAAPSAPAVPTQPTATVAQNSQPAVVTPTQESAPQQQAKAEPATPTQSAQTEAKVEPVAATQPVKQASANSCNAQACSASYRSFRAADCTYQPAEGDRRACSIGRGGAVSARAAKPERMSRRASEPDDVSDVERVVKRQPLDLQPKATARASSSRGEMTEVERIVRHMTRDEDADIPVQDGYGRVFIVRKGYR
jgi:hypothetical protein